MKIVKESIKFSKEGTSINAFYRSLQIYIKKPQVVNRKISCLKNLSFLKINKNELKDEILKCENLEKVEEILKSNECLKETIEILSNEHFINDECNSLLISIDKITSKNNINCYQLFLLDKQTNCASFRSFDKNISIIPAIDYSICFNKSELQLLVDEEDVSNPACNWLQYVLLKKLNSWIQSYDEEDKNEARIESHSLIDNEEYSILYASLKEKYGKRLELIWNEESTDPKKFIYEEIGIASYLITFWKRLRDESKSEKLQSFIDMGCGNGVLTYVLANEGHRGFGIDVKERKIWKKFDPKIDLREKTWTPGEYYEDVDFIIGNHSDELSPWIPIVAARSSYKCNYFLLPCCAYEFSGAKFQRKGHSKSLYMSFIDYLKEISSICSFESTLIDRLKIPSTKRICLIGLNRSYEIEKYSEQLEVIENFIKSSDERSKSFVPREKIQIIRNCTKLDKNLSERIIRTIFDAILSEQSFCEEYGNYNLGRQLTFEQAVKLISDDDLKKLKSESGGLQTLLKNKHQIFEVYSGKIKIRKPKRISDTKLSVKSAKRNVIKSSPCYFYLNHKQGCFLKDEECCYKH